MCAPLASLGGAVTHLRRLLPRFAAEPDVDWSFLGPTSLTSALTAALDGFELFHADCTRYRDRMNTEIEIAPRVAREVGADVVYGPLGLYSPPLMERLVWIPHNVAPYSERFLRTQPPAQVARLTALRWMHVFGARHARLTTCISKHGRDSLSRVSGVAAERFPVIHHGAEVPAPPPPAERARLRQQLGLESPFVLSVAHGYRYKNLVELVRAFSIVRDRAHILGDRRAHGATELRLALAGAWPDEAYAAEVHDEVARLGLERAVRFLGSRDAHELAALEVEAELVAATSWLENCPTSLLEQLHLGCAIVCSSEPSMPEHVGDAALLVDVDEPESIADGMGRVLADPELRAALQARARLRAKRFRWEETARRTLGAIRWAARATSTFPVDLDADPGELADSSAENTPESHGRPS